MTSNAIQLQAVDTSLAVDRAPEMSVKDIVERVQKVQDVAAQVMKEGHDYGKIPGVEKDVLFKPGAEILALTFRLDPQIVIQERIWHEDGHLTVVACCTMFHAPTGMRLGSGLGVCSTKESKYAWRKADRVCPRCGKAAIFKSKNQGDGFYCWAKKEGCGAKFKDGDKSITEQQVGRVPNPDLADCYNTVVKMAAKRAQIAATLIVTCASRIFTQDQEDFIGDEPEEPPPRKPGSGTQVPSEHISPHLYPDDDPRAPRNPNEEGDRLYEAIMKRFASMEEQIAKLATYDDALLVRAQLGSKAKPSQLNREIQTAREKSMLDHVQGKELGRTWQRLDRQLTKKEAELRTDAAGAFTDPDTDA